MWKVYHILSVFAGFTTPNYPVLGKDALRLTHLTSPGKTTGHGSAGSGRPQCKITKFMALILEIDWNEWDLPPVSPAFSQVQLSVLAFSE